MKTQKVIDECMGGVLFIDEAYSLGNKEGRDIFSKECIDTLNYNLSEKRDFLCIIAGYERDLEECFFKHNSGLRRRFTFRYDILSYSPEELLKIFELKVRMAEWRMCYESNYYDNNTVLEEKTKYVNIILELFKDNENNFPNFGGDVETLFLNCKISHSKRCIFKNDEARKVLSVDDIKNGLNDFLKHRNGTNNKFNLELF